MEWKSSASLTLLNLFQSIVINIGLFGISLYCAFLVAGHQYTVGDYVLLGSYFLQLMTPLNWLGTLYRVIQGPIFLDEFMAIYYRAHISRRFYGNLGYYSRAHIFRRFYGHLLQSRAHIFRRFYGHLLQGPYF